MKLAKVTICEQTVQATGTASVSQSLNPYYAKVLVSFCCPLAEATAEIARHIDQLMKHGKTDLSISVVDSISIDDKYIDPAYRSK